MSSPDNLMFLSQEKVPKPHIKCAVVLSYHCENVFPKIDILCGRPYADLIKTAQQIIFFVTHESFAYHKKIYSIGRDPGLYGVISVLNCNNTLYRILIKPSRI